MSEQEPRGKAAEGTCEAHQAVALLMAGWWNRLACHSRSDAKRGDCGGWLALTRLGDDGQTGEKCCLTALKRLDCAGGEVGVCQTNAD